MRSRQSRAFRNRWLSLIPNCSWFNFSRCVCVKDCNSERNSSTSLRRCSKLCWFFTSITSLLASNLGRVRVTWHLVDISLTQLIWAPLLPNTFLGLNGFFGAVLARLGDVHAFGSAYLEGFCPNRLQVFVLVLFLDLLLIKVTNLAFNGGPVKRRCSKMRMYKPAITAIIHHHTNCKIALR